METNSHISVPTTDFKKILGRIDLMGSHLTFMQVNEKIDNARLEHTIQLLADVYTYMIILSQIEYDIRDADAMAKYGKTVAEMMCEELNS